MRKHTAMYGAPSGGNIPQEFFLNFRLHLVGFGQNIQHGQHTDVLEVSAAS